MKLQYYSKNTHKRLVYSNKLLVDVLSNSRDDIQKYIIAMLDQKIIDTLNYDMAIGVQRINESINVYTVYSELAKLVGMYPFSKDELTK